MDVARKGTRENQEIDRISDLPNSLIDNILDRVPIGDAVRTSILSKQWHYHWTRVGNLVFDCRFVDDEIMFLQTRRKQKWDCKSVFFNYIDAVNSVMLLHNGPIHKFELHIPCFSSVPYKSTVRHVSNWMDIVSCSGVKEFTIEVPKTRDMRLPSTVFDCVELRRLALNNCRFDLPDNFRGFHNLISLELNFLSIPEHGLGPLISKCLQLETLSTVGCRGPLSIIAHNIKTLSVWASGLTKFTLQNAPNLSTLYIMDLGLSAEQQYRYNIVDFVCLIPNIINVTFTGTTLLFLSVHPVPKTLLAPLTYHKYMTLLDFKASAPSQISCALCIIRSSPNLQTLRISFSSLSLKDNGAAAAAILEKQMSEPSYLSNLITVEITGLRGTRTQIMLLKYILVSCTALEDLYVNAVYTIREDTELAMMSELKECIRASSKAKIIYAKHQSMFRPRCCS